MKTCFFVFFTLLHLASLHSQEDDPDNLVYVAGPIYKIIDAEGGPEVLWRGQPASAGQVKQPEPGLLTVAPSATAAPRLLIYLKPDGRMDRVVDLAYQRDPRQRERHDPVTETTKGEEPLEITFPNGLVFVYDAGVASASLNGHPVAVTGGNGRYRIESDTYEVGIAFGAQWKGKVYHYFRDK